MKLQAIKCPACNEIIFSRTRHDFHWCHCGATAIDGGFDYVKITAKDPAKVSVFQLEVDATQKELYNDWNTGTDKFGWVQG